MLRASGEHDGKTLDIESVMGGSGDVSGVPHAPLLLDFVEAMLAPGRGRRERARETLRQVLGDRALVDAAGIVASFNAVVKLADGTGIPLEEDKARATEALRAELGIDAMAP